MGQSSTPNTLLDQLQACLDVALSVVRDLSDDDLLKRLISAFHAMPAEDRPVIIGVLEREVLGRALSRATEKAVAQATHPNPNARLYVRSHAADLDRGALDRNAMVVADVRAMRIAAVIRGIPDLFALWKDALHEAVGQVDAGPLRAAQDLLREGLASVTEALAAVEQAGDAAAAPPEAAPDAKTRRRRS